MAEIVGVVASVLGLVVELGKCIVQPIKRRFNYLCCFNNNIKSLLKESEKLENERNGLEMQVGTAKRNAEVILPGVENWLARANEIKVHINGIGTEKRNVERSFLNMKSRFLLSRKAKKATEVMKELLGDCKFNPIAQPAPPPATRPIPIETCEFDSRKQIEDDIMEALKAREVNMLGICGMAGVGKTTMAKRIRNRALDEKLYDEVVMVVIGQQVIKLTIQLEIAESVGLKFDVDSLSARAAKLSYRLKDTTRILVILDDVWDELQLEELGIPCKSGVEGCTILLTARDMKVLTAMNVQKNCELKILPKGEDWSLFRKKVGSCVDDQDLVSIAQDVVNESKGLPIALVTVAGALKDKKNKFTWEDALQQLKNPKPVNMKHVLDYVYNSIKLSYNFMDDDPQAQSVFLLCSLFPEDSNVRLEFLTWCSMGLGIFETMNLRDARNRVRSLVEQLKNRFLLEYGKDEHYVKMHDVVRDVAIFIASQEGRVDSKSSSIDWWLEHSDSDCNWVSVSPIEEIQLPIVLKVPSLRLLLIRNKNWSEIEMHDQSFEVMKELNVMSLRHISFKPEALQFLKKLKALNLKHCTLESVSVVGQLRNLQILRCHSCDLITELPEEIGGLIHLRLLDFSFCTSLKRVAPGVISSFVKLEELKMLQSFRGWEAEENGKERSNASLNELQSLSNLTCLEIEIEDYTLAAQDISLSSPKIEKYEIRFTQEYEIRFMLCDSGETFEKMMNLELPIEICLGDWILNFLRNTEYLELEGDGSNNVDLAQVQNIKRFDFSECSTVKKLVSTTSIDRSFDVFPVLESLKLDNLPNLEEICDGPIEAGSSSFNNLLELEILELPALMYLWNSQNQNVSLSNLTSISIWKCDNLRNLFSLKMAKDGLFQLKELDIQICGMMEEVFSNEKKNDEQGHIKFPKLEKLTLNDLPSLTTLCKGIESIKCPVLTKMDIGLCPKLCNLFPLKMAKDGLFQLKELDIQICGMMEEVFSNEKENDEEGHIKFPKLEKLTLYDLPRLTTLCKGIESIECPVLTKMEIYECLKLTSFVSCTGNSSSLEGHNDDCLHFFCNQKVTFGSLKELKIIECENISNIWCHHIPPTGSFGQLETLSITYCGSIRSLFSSSIATNLVNLKELWIESCNEMVKVIGDHEENVCENSQWRCALELPSLRKIFISYCTRMEGFTMGSLTTPKLASINIWNCGKLRNLFPLTMANNGLLQLKRLHVRDCESIEEVFFNVNENDGKCHITFPELEHLTLECLTNLTTFYKGIDSFEFPQLRETYINCPKLTDFATSNPSVAGRSDDSFQLFCNQKVTFGSLQTLKIQGYENISNLWCYQIPSANFFSKLEVLKIKKCGSIRSLFTSSIAANLVNLKILKIKSCNVMVKVIGDDEENVCENSQLMFPNLDYLSLTSLPNLLIFCGWRCALQLPLLRTVIICDCPRMESFTMGSLTTPNLNHIWIDGLVKFVENWNGVLQLYFREKREEKESEEEENEEELDEHVQEVWDEEK